MKIKIGQFYRNKNNEIIKITEYHSGIHMYKCEQIRCLGDNASSYWVHNNGCMYQYDIGIWDLDIKLTKEENPEYFL